MDIERFHREAEGGEVLNLIAGDSLKIETNFAAGGGQEVLLDTVPIGKKRRYTLRVDIIEEEA